MAISVFLLLALCCSSASAAIQVRLVDGAAPSEGRVEIFLNNTWWTACATTWSTSNAVVICRQLGYSSGSSARNAVGFFGNPPSSRPMLLDYFSCSGSASTLDACTHYPGYISSCPSQYHAGVVCEPYVHPPMQVRLRDGQTSAYGVEGRLEVSSNGTWGTICDDNIDIYATRLICRMLGYNSGSQYVVYGSLYGSGSGPILITRLQCQSSDTNLTTCLQLNSSNFACPNSQVAGIVCNYTRTSENIPVRLEGPSPYKGIVELFVYGTWRKVCTNGPDQSKAQVICRQLGWNLSDDNVGSSASFISASTPFSNRVFIPTSCFGKENNIGNCTLYQPLGSQNCLRQYEFGVFCYPDQLETTTQVMSTTPQPATTAVTTRELSTEKKVKNPETATEKSSSNPSDVGANKTELILVAGILGATLALALIIILIFAIVQIRDRRRGAVYLADANRGSQQQAGQAPGREEFYQNVAFQDQAAAPVPPATAEPEHTYEDLQRKAPRHK